jgi:hypothetical protein
MTLDAEALAGEQGRERLKGRATLQQQGRAAAHANGVVVVAGQGAGVGVIAALGLHPG